MSCFLSIIIPTYNRRDLVGLTIDSALHFIDHLIMDAEIIVVDDASTDNTSECIEARYLEELDAGVIKLIQHEINLGVTGAMNTGIFNATGKWLLFVGSDDLLIPEVSKTLQRILEADKGYPIIFFRCEDLNTGSLIGPHRETSYNLTLSDFLNRGTPGECLSVVKASCFSRFLFDPDLRGGEGFTFAQMIREYGEARVETLVARKYRTGYSDQLSFGTGVLRRACHVGEYHRRMIIQFHRHLNCSTICKTMVKIICYRFVCLLIRFRKKGFKINPFEHID